MVVSSKLRCGLASWLTLLIDGKVVSDTQRDPGVPSRPCTTTAANAMSTVQTAPDVPSLGMLRDTVAALPRSVRSCHSSNLVESPNTRHIDPLPRLDFSSCGRAEPFPRG